MSNTIKNLARGDYEPLESSKIPHLPISIYLLALSLFAMGSAEFLMGGILPQIASDLRISLPTAGTLISAFAAGALIGAPPLALITLHWSRRRTLFASQAVFVIATISGMMIDGYHAGRAGVQIDFSDGHPAEHIAAVRLHQLDVAFVTGIGQHAGCQTVHLWSEQVFAALPTAHFLAERQSLIWQDLIGETFIVGEQSPGREIHGFLIRHLSGPGRYPDVSRQNVGRDNLLSLVAIGRGLTLTSEATTSAHFMGVVYRPIAGEILPFSAVWSPNNDNPALRRLLSMARARRRCEIPTSA